MLKGRGTGGNVREKRHRRQRKRDRWQCQKEQGQEAMS
jgi:hypothetical protein